jgi:hypothetical protein
VFTLIYPPPLPPRSSSPKFRLVKRILVNSAFMELAGKNAVKEIVEQSLSISTNKMDIEEVLKPSAEFVTERESWSIGG